LTQPDYQPFPNVARRNFMQERLELPLLIGLLGLPKRGRILEVGCGRGVALPVIARTLEPLVLIGLDIDSSLLVEAMRRARQRGVIAAFRQGDVRRLPFPMRSFDMVIDFGTCYHIGSPDVALKEISRVLKPGGLFVYETPTSQLLSHPVRTRGARLPWASVPELRVWRDRVLWKARRKEG
jgi:2-polyprenyl-6-hydroxyphenyl methylase/3-demethylubiquinone-9 3-methyltransferase